MQRTRLSFRLSAAFILFAWVMTATSCTSPPTAKELTAAQFKGYVYGANGYHSTTFKGVRYAGTDAHFDYVALVHTDSIGGNEMFKVRAGELGLTSHMSVKGNPREWVDVSADFPLPQPSPR